MIRRLISKALRAWDRRNGATVVLTDYRAMLLDATRNTVTGQATSGRRAYDRSFVCQGG